MFDWVLNDVLGSAVWLEMDFVFFFHLFKNFKGCFAVLFDHQHLINSPLLKNVKIPRFKFQIPRFKFQISILILDEIKWTN